MEKIGAEERLAEAPQSPKMAEESPSSAGGGRLRKGGFVTMPFIIVNESFEKVASYGLISNMIFYLMRDYHLETSSSASILFISGALSNGLSIVGAFLSDSLMGRFWAIAFGSLVTLSGMTVLWLTAMIPQLRPPPCVLFSSDCVSPTAGQIFFLILSFALMALGAGFIRPCSMAFGADQVEKKDDPKRERLLQSFFNWYYTSVAISTILGFTVLVYIQDHLGWKVGYGVPALLMLVSTVMFFVGTPLYVKKKAGKSLFSSLLQAFVAAFRKRKLSLSASEIKYHKDPKSKKTAPSKNLRCLNKACIITDPEKELKEDGSPTNPWTLCTIKQVEALKSLIRVLPIWSTGIMVMVCLTQSYATVQANVMDRHLSPHFKIPAGSFTVFTILTVSIWLPIWDRAIVPLLAKFTGKPKGIGMKTRIGIGILLTVVAMAVSALVERMRRAKAIEQGLRDNPVAVMDMTAMWLVPQHVVFGLAESFNAIGQIEFFYSELPASMGSIAIALFSLSGAGASVVGGVVVQIVNTVTKKGGKVSWLDNNLNKGHVDYYYWLIFVMAFLNFGYFMICSWLYGPTNDEKPPAEDADSDDEIKIMAF